MANPPKRKQNVHHAENEKKIRDNVMNSGFLGGCMLMLTQILSNNVLACMNTLFVNLIKC